MEWLHEGDEHKKKKWFSIILHHNYYDIYIETKIYNLFTFNYSIILLYVQN